MFLSDQNLLTWTDSAIYIFTPHSGQVLLWTEVKGEMHKSIFTPNIYISLILFYDIIAHGSLSVFPKIFIINVTIIIKLIVI